MSLSSEMLDAEEVAQITGCSRRADQNEWLSTNGWAHHKNKAGVAIVGRLYARLRMAGIHPATLVSPGGWVPDFSGLR